jgi:PBP1b-binding outer membrane lipoprotein LpoB
MKKRLALLALGLTLFVSGCPKTATTATSAKTTNLETRGTEPETIIQRPSPTQPK